MDAVAETQSKEETSVEKTYDLSIVKSASAVSEMKRDMSLASADTSISWCSQITEMRSEETQKP